MTEKDESLKTNLKIICQKINEHGPYFVDTFMSMLKDGNQIIKNYNSFSKQGSEFISQAKTSIAEEYSKATNEYQQGNYYDILKIYSSLAANLASGAVVKIASNIPEVILTIAHGADLTFNAIAGLTTMDISGLQAIYEIQKSELSDLLKNGLLSEFKKIEPEQFQAITEKFLSHEAIEKTKSLLKIPSSADLKLNFFFNSGFNLIHYSSAENIAELEQSLARFIIKNKEVKDIIKEKISQEISKLPQYENEKLFRKKILEEIEERSLGIELNEEKNKLIKSIAKNLIHLKNNHSDIINDFSNFLRENKESTAKIIDQFLEKLPTKKKLCDQLNISTEDLADIAANAVSAEGIDSLINFLNNPSGPNLIRLTIKTKNIRKFSSIALKLPKLYLKGKLNPIKNKIKEAMQSIPSNIRIAELPVEQSQPIILSPEQNTVSRLNKALKSFKSHI